MANMGSTGTVNITKAMMDAAIKAVDDYQSQVTGINSELQSEIDGLIPSSFSVQQLMVLRLLRYKYSSKCY